MSSLLWCAAKCPPPMACATLARNGPTCLPIVHPNNAKLQLPVLFSTSDFCTQNKELMSVLANPGPTVSSLHHGKPAL